MKITQHRPGVYYAHVKTETGTQKIRFEASSMTQARQLAKQAKLEELETAATVKALTAETIMRITSGGRTTCEETVAMWREWAETVGLVPNTRERYNTYIQAFIREFNLSNKPPSAIREAQLNAFVNPPDSNIKAATRLNRKHALHSWFLVLIGKGLVVGKPMSLVQVHFHAMTRAQKEPLVRQPFTPDELTKLRDIDSDFWRAAVALSLHTGLRLSDVCQLEWDCFSKPGKIVVWTDKRDVRVVLPLTREVEKVIAAIPKTHPQYLFPEERDIIQNPKLRSKLSTYFNRHLKRLGIADRSFHCLRHTFATNLAAQPGETVDSIRLRLGHALTDTTNGYIHA